MQERRDLQGLQVTSDTGNVAVVRKGGLPLLDGQSMRVSFEYRGGYHSIVLPADATSDAVAAAIAERLVEIDDEIALQELVGEVVQ